MTVLTLKYLTLRFEIARLHYITLDMYLHEQFKYRKEMKKKKRREIIFQKYVKYSAMISDVISNITYMLI